MPSPFPGMDPYLEAHWLDIQCALAAEVRRLLNSVLHDGLAARIHEREVIEPSPVHSEPLIERSIHVVERAALVTVLEFLSPTNKRPPGLDEYRERRAELLSGGVHLVEIDLVRAGNWRALMRPAACPPEAATPYRATIWTSGPRPEAYLYPIPINAPLPEIDIPLRPSDTPVRLPLQPLLTNVYQEGRYDQTIDYRLPPDPPLDENDAAWAQGLLKSADRR